LIRFEIAYTQAERKPQACSSVPAGEVLIVVSQVRIPPTAR
jgi:hypothetical protein